MSDITTEKPVLSSTEAVAGLFEVLVLLIDFQFPNLHVYPLWLKTFSLGAAHSKGIYSNSIFSGDMKYVVPSSALNDMISPSDKVFAPVDRFSIEAQQPSPHGLYRRQTLFLEASIATLTP